MKPNHQLRILWGSEVDTGTQRCRLSTELIQDLGGRLASPACISISENHMIFCTLWPRQDNYNCYIDLSDLVSIQSNDHNDIKRGKKCITLTDIDIINNVGAIKIVHVDVIVKDYRKVKKWKRSNSESKFKAVHALRKLILCPGCQVNIKQTAMERLFGLSWIKVNSIECFGTGHLKYGRCVSDTCLIIDRVLSTERFEQKLGNISFTKCLGGLSREFELLREMVELSRLYIKGYAGFRLMSGALLQGPSGCGKTSLVYCVARETNSFLQVVNGVEVFGSRLGETEENLKTAFEKAEVISEEGPCILFLDELDTLCPAKGHGTVEQRTASLLVNLVDKIITSSHVTVIGATNQSGVLDAAIRRPQRLEKEVCFEYCSL